MSVHQPPSAAQRLLSRRLRSPAAREGILGDLGEEYAERALKTGRLRLDLWYWRQCFLICLRYRVPPRAPSRTRQGRTMMNGLMDLRYAFRSLAKSPAFVGAVILAAAPTIGANTAIFSLIDAALLRPLPYQQPERLTEVFNLSPQGRTDNVSPGDFLDWRDQNTVFSAMAAFHSDAFNLTGRGDPIRLRGLRVSGELFRLLGAKPLFGRGLDVSDSEPGSGDALVLSHSLWRNRFSSDPSVIGQSIIINERPHLISGVMPASFRFPDGTAQLWAPLKLTPEDRNRRRSFYLRVVGRLSPGVEKTRADQEMKDLAQRIRRENPQTHDQSVVVKGLHQSLVGDFAFNAWMLQSAMALLLLTACANMANLQLGRSLGRRQEIATRLALGASRMRIVRQLMIESLIPTLAAGATGVGLAYAALPILKSALPEATWAADFGIDSRALLFALAVTLLSALVFALLPALKASRSDAAAALSEGNRNPSHRLAARTRDSLAIFEIASATVLLVCAGLMLRTFSSVTSVELGFRPQGLLTVRMDLPLSKYRLGPEREGFYRRLLGTVEGIAGVESAGMTASLPFTVSGGALGFAVEGKDFPDDEPVFAVFRGVSPGYLPTMDIALLAGRRLTWDDFRPGRAVVIINQAMADKYWPGENPLSHRLKLMGARSSHPWAEVVGVVANARRFQVEADPPPAFYAPSSQVPIPFFTPHHLAIRTSTPPLQAVAAVRKAVADIDPSLPLFDIQTMDDIVHQAVGGQRSNLTFFAGLGLLSCLLASLGIYGVISYLARGRRREFGLRLAVGAARKDIIRLVLSGGIRLAVLGTILGCAAALALTKLLESWLWGVSARDPLTYLGSAGILIALSLAASVPAAWRATLIDPALTLRQD